MLQKSFGQVEDLCESMEGDEVSHFISLHFVRRASFSMPQKGVIIYVTSLCIYEYFYCRAWAVRSIYRQS